jgi:hypothetical protein
MAAILAAAAAAQKPRDDYFTTSDRARLHYLEAGKGRGGRRIDRNSRLPFRWPGFVQGWRVVRTLAGRGIPLPAIIAVVESSRMQDFEDDQIPIVHGSGEGLMEEGPGLHAGARRNEDIALDLMKFVAMTTGYGRTTSSGVGFQGSGSAAKPEDYAAHLLELYGKCLSAVAGKR